MQFDMGIYGLGILVAMSLGFGLVMQLLGAAWRWEWVVAAIGWFVGGLFMSEVMFATATVDEIQPIIDGLAFDEALLGGLVAGLVVVAVTRYLTGGFPFGRVPSA